MDNIKTNLFKMLDKRVQKVTTYTGYNKAALQLFQTITAYIEQLNQEISANVKNSEAVKIKVEGGLIEWLGIYYQLSMNESGTVNIISIDPVTNDTQRIDIIIELDGALFSSKFNTRISENEAIILKLLTSHERFNNLEL
ncbi:hypothetical protein ERX27_08705 [Macrococcus brunensis]|uniref:Uncharacterized protein n=1 Tax=Macrococcus brunensis TaxID=198483 RepID=A0A4R6BC49_9STAP|nr:hypothetical protein [Macrococcus brunensis]TDL95354.1 hypothetical protein ERX27_08705 [Macrococcus brunensis]ULG75191.1 hypothetical protein MGG13_05340 [Macrococcus brunensis]